MTIFPLLAKGKRCEDERWILDLFQSFHVSIKLKTEVEKKCEALRGQKQSNVSMLLQMWNHVSEAFRDFYN